MWLATCSLMMHAFAAGNTEEQPPAAGLTERLGSGRMLAGRQHGERGQLARSGSLVRRDAVSASFGHHR